MKQYDPKIIEPKWQKIWEDTNLYVTEEDSNKPFFYQLTMFPYPSGDLHTGHWYALTAPDVLARYQRRNNQNVLFPMGWDAFGLPAENAAIKRGIPPAEWTRTNIASMKKQLSRMGASFDWNKELSTADPDYYRWTQELFLLLHKHGLAYRKKGLQNWCPSCQTVLANEQVVGEEHLCERCDTPVEKKELEQWFFKITDYAERLLEDIEDVDWPEKVKTMQKNWIGKSEGAVIEFAIANSGKGKREKGKGVRKVRSYIMGIGNIDDELKKAGIEVSEKTKEGHYKVAFPASRLSEYENIIAENMKPGFWNEYVSNEVVFIFKDSQDQTKRIVWSNGNEQKILRLCNDYADAEFTSVKAMLTNNEWYKDHLPPTNYHIPVFTTRPDTLFGATYIVLAPEHELVNEVTTKEQRKVVTEYVKEAERKSDIERQDEHKDKTGVFTGAYATNPVNGEDIPVWVADYVLMGYGTGAIMAVPAHDQRDYEFAKKFDLPIKTVIEPVTGERQKDPEFRRSIVAIVENPKGELLSINWGADGGGNLFIGGGLEESEDMVECAKREVREETGYENLEFIGQSETVHHHYFAHSKNVAREIEATGLYFKLTDEKKTEQQLEEDEKGKFRIEWITREKVATDVRDELHKYVFERLVLDQIYTGEGKMVNSSQYDGLDSVEVSEKIVEDLAKKAAAEKKINYKLRDWLISRQRYWGAPIPILYCDKCGTVPVPNEQLPVLLPEDVEFEPTGQSPLVKLDDFVNTDCPECGGPARREVDTMDTFVDSSWYFLRYPNPNYGKGMFDPEAVSKWLPVDHYTGGIEHAIMHLLYSRFITKVLHDYAGLKFTEPFKKLSNQGMILGPNGLKMSKSRGNVVSPDEIIDSGYGADAFRTYMLFIGPWTEGGPFNTNGLAGTYRFLNRVWTLAHEYIDSKAVERAGDAGELELELLSGLHKTVQKVSKDMEALSFNTAIAAQMELVNSMYKLKEKLPFGAAPEVWSEVLEGLLLVLAPFAPHVTEELWSELSSHDSIHIQGWPVADEKYLDTGAITVVVQVNGKVRAQLPSTSGTIEEQAVELAKADPRIDELLAGKEVVKTIYVPDKLVNFVVK